ncbi:uncharacterized protein si:dkeyp-117h8.4 [Nerophis ophidion]|uniref:uncharacterized protein si:dkeyp-117h8.4 n=1 Tax=Nerophis ophidion TaxID=159077 RepID=UPI002AE05A54|nr:uncharacterized protein si:dkeyp-117h8.4 [Nerophis ophidion]
MDLHFKDRLQTNGLIYKKALDRIIDKYSKIQCQAAIDLDLAVTSKKALGRFMDESEKKIDSLTAKSLTCSREDRLGLNEASRISRLELTQQNGDESHIIDHLSSDDEESVNSYLTMSLLDDSQRNLSEIDSLPEDQDEELEMSLRSGGSRLSELYPAMIDQIGRARHREHVSKVAEGVVRRYRKWRRMSKNHRGTAASDFVHRSVDAREKTNQASWQRPVVTEPRQKPVAVPDPSYLESLKPRKNLLNKTFIVGEQPPYRSLGPPRFFDVSIRSQMLTHSAPESVHCSPLRQSPLKTRLKSSSGSPMISSREPVRSASPLRQSPLKTRLKSSNGSPMTSSREPVRSASPLRQSPLKTRLKSSSGSPMISSREPVRSASPLRQSPLKTRLKSSNGSPMTSSREPVRSASPLRQSPLKTRLKSSSGSPLTSSREPVRSAFPLGQSPLKTRLKSSSGSPLTSSREPVRSASPLPKSPVRQKMLHPEPRPLSPVLRRRRHLIFDASPPPGQVPHSPKELDKEFVRFYHKLVCQNQPHDGPPCRLCARSSEAARQHSSRTLLALALSPHRLVLRKRHRERDRENESQAKRRSAYSPGSKRHNHQALRRCLCMSDDEASNWSSAEPSRFGSPRKISNYSNYYQR